MVCAGFYLVHCGKNKTDQQQQQSASNWRRNELWLESAWWAVAPGLSVSFSRPNKYRKIVNRFYYFSHIFFHSSFHSDAFDLLRSDDQQQQQRKFTLKLNVVDLWLCCLNLFHSHFFCCCLRPIRYELGDSLQRGRHCLQLDKSQIVWCFKRKISTRRHY